MTEERTHFIQKSLTDCEQEIREIWTKIADIEKNVSDLNTSHKIIDLSIKNVADNIKSLTDDFKKVNDRINDSMKEVQSDLNCFRKEQAERDAESNKMYKSTLLKFGAGIISALILVALNI